MNKKTTMDVSVHLEMNGQRGHLGYADLDNLAEIVYQVTTWVTADATVEGNFEYVKSMRTDEGNYAFVIRVS